jgi:hypothetical protein
MHRSVRSAALLTCATMAFLLPMNASHSWGGYHWARQTFSFALSLGDNVSAVWDPILATTASDWSESTVLDTTVAAGGANPKNCRATLGRVEVCNSTYGNNGWLGIAQIWASGNHITQGVVKLNDTYFRTAKYNTTAWRNLVSCQEVGHTLGLDHQDENFSNANLGTCMDYTNNPSTNQNPNSHDYAQLVEIYYHLDSTTTVSSSQTSPTSTNDAEPNSWGKLVSSSRNGTSETYELELGNGRKVITHVTWAEEHPRGRGAQER